MAKKNASRGKNAARAGTTEDPALKAIRSLGTRDDIGLTQRCCDRIKAYVTARLKDLLPADEQLEIGGGIGAIVREESWSLAAAALRLRGDHGRGEDAGTDEEKIGRFILTAYVLDSLGLLPEEKGQRLEEATELAGRSDWRRATGRGLKEEYGFDGKGIKALYAAAVKQMDGLHALMFVLRGIGIFEALRAMHDVLGQEGLQALGERVVREHPRPKRRG
jgi:hypothetical protein